MRFYDRKKELGLLAEIEAQSHRHAQFTVITGRRRIGKTSLILKSCQKKDFAYLFVERKDERDLCQTFKEELETRLGMTIHGRPTSFAEIFEELLKLAKSRPITVVIDEFQEFLKVNPSVFSSIQRLWDLHKDEARINLIVSGSFYTLMQKIFKTKKASLYGRETGFIRLDPFSTSVLKEILGEYHPRYTPDDLLALWTFTGGVAKYIELLVDRDACTRNRMIDLIVREDSTFLEEGKAVLVEEFGKDYGVYFSVLSAIATGRNTRNEVSQALGRDVGGYLTRLENDYALISRKQPLFAKPSARGAHYQMNDCFFEFWFRFIFKYGFLLEIKGYDKVREIIRRDYPVFSGRALERYFRAKLIESGDYTRIGGWWDRKGENEIDLLAENEIDKRAVFFEVKRQNARYSAKALEEKADQFLKATGRFRGYDIRLQGLSLNDL